MATIKVVLLLAGLTSGLGFVEWGMRFNARRLARSDRLAPGLVRHDPELGWSLVPFWRGTHSHADFDVEYGVASDGFRSDPHRPNLPRGRSIAVLGDSFVFGIGVRDDQTFTSILNRDSPHTWWNCGVPGFSTDQELLLLRRQVLPKRPDAVVLVLYLGNDVLDNARPVPLQVRASKPYFSLTSGELRLNNAPVPVEPPEAWAPVGDLASVVIPAGSPHSWRIRWAGHSALAGTIISLVPVNDLGDDVREAMADEIGLAVALVKATRLACEQAGVSFALVLLPGRSWVVAPASLSSAYQEWTRKRLLEEVERETTTVLDVGERLRSAASSGGGALFFDRDGHLTPEGHQCVAVRFGELIDRFLRPR